MKTRQLYLVDDNEDFLQATCFWLEGLGLAVTSWQDPALAIRNWANATSALKPA